MAGGPSYREAKGGDVQPALLVLLRVGFSRSPTAWNSSLTPSPLRNHSGDLQAADAPLPDPAFHPSSSPTPVPRITDTEPAVGDNGDRPVAGQRSARQPRQPS